MTAADRTESGLPDRIERALGWRPAAVSSLGGGSTVPVCKLTVPGREPAVAKWGDAALADGRDPNLVVEAHMLRTLRRESTLPLPDVLYADDGLLVMTYLPDDGAGPGPESQRRAADHLAALHAIPRETFGFDRDTTIGILPQPNPPTAGWLSFFGNHRLRHMAEAGRREGTVTGELSDRVERLAARLDRWLDEPAHPALLHGDVWTGNVLSHGGNLSGFIDPAAYWGHPEIELAFTTLFGTFGKPFFERYGEHAPIDAGFFEIRRDIYNIYPLLVHVRSWSAGYARPIEQTLDRLGL